MRFFDLDGPVYRVGTEIADLMILTLYWFIGCLPIITIGASTTSLFYVYGKKVRGEDAYITRDFIKSFKENFKQSIPLTLILLLLWASSLFYFLVFGLAGQGGMLGQIGACFFTIEVILVSLYIFAILSRFYMGFSQLFFTAFILANKHLLTSISMLLILVGGIIVFFYFPLSIIALPAAVVGVLSISIQQIFKKNMQINETKQDEQDEDEGEDQDQDPNEDNDNSLEEVLNEQSEDEDKDFLKYI